MLALSANLAAASAGFNGVHRMKKTLESGMCLAQLCGLPTDCRRTLQSSVCLHAGSSVSMYVHVINIIYECLARNVHNLIKQSLLEATHTDLMSI